MPALDDTNDWLQDAQKLAALGNPLGQRSVEAGRPLWTTPTPQASAPQALGSAPPQTPPLTEKPSLASHLGDIVHHITNHPMITGQDLGSGAQAPQQPASAPMSNGGISSPAQGEYERLHHVLRPDISDPGGTGLTLPGEQEHSKENTGASGISQIKNPWARIPLQVLDAIGGAVAPRLTQGIPGTQLHHNELAQASARNVGEEEAVQNSEQKRSLEAAQAEKDLNPAAEKAAKLPSNETELWIQQNPHGTAEDLKNFLQKTAPDKPITNETELWIKQHPNGTAEDLQKFLSAGKTDKEGNDFERFYKLYLNDNGIKDSSSARLKAEGQFAAAKQLPQRPPQVSVFVPGPNGQETLQSLRPGQAVPEGAQTTQEHIASNKETHAAAKASQEADSDYRLAQQFAANPSPTNDMGLLMHFIGATKPDSIGKLRLNQNEINLMLGTRSSFGDLEAFAQKVANGQKLTPQQRTDMLDTMKLISDSHKRPEQGGGGGGVPEYVRDPKTNKLVLKQ